MNSQLCFPGARITVSALKDGHVQLIVANSVGTSVLVTLGADGAALVGAELERAALSVQRAERNAAAAKEFARLPTAYRERTECASPDGKCHEVLSDCYPSNGGCLYAQMNPRKAP